MSGMSYNSRKAALLFFTILYFSGIKPAGASLDIAETAKNFNNRKKQTMLQGKIDTLVIKRDNVEIYLGTGDVTLYDFGAEKHSMMFYNGPGRFVYTPPDDSERKYLQVLTGLEKIDGLFKDASFLMAIEDIALIDTSLFKREKIKERDWREVTRFNEELAEYLGSNPHLRIFGDILTGNPTSCFLVKFKVDDIGDLVYCEDPLCDDFCRIYRYTDKDKPPDILAAYSADSISAKQRENLSIDIIHYDINAKINGIGKIESDCRIRFKPLREGLQFIYFDLSKDLKTSLVTDSAGENLPFFSWDDSPGCGAWLDQPMQVGNEYQIDVEYEGRPFDYEWEIYFSNERQPWYPKSILPDRFSFAADLKYPDDYELAFQQAVVAYNEEKEAGTAKWVMNNDVGEVPFCAGPILTGGFLSKDRVKVNMFAPELYNWILKSEPTETRVGVVVNVLINLMADFHWFDKSSDELSKDLYIYHNIMDKCEFDTICVVEAPDGNHIGSAGIIPLSTTFDENYRTRNRFTRAHELAHVWWGQTVGIDTESDKWILEGLAEYFAYLANQDPYGREDEPDSILLAWRDSILTASVDGLPISLGSRLSNSVFDHYDNLVITKSAYIFHMIRYMLYDFNQNSDRIFLKFLRDIVETYKWRSIDVQGLNAMLEKHIGMEMDWFFRQWVNGTKIPRYHVSFDFPETADSTYSVNLHVKQEDVPPDFKMIIPVKIDMADDYYVVHKLMIDQPDKEIKISQLPYEPIDLKFNLEKAVLCREASQGD